MNKIILLVSSFVSCFIVINILFQFLNERYQKAYHNKTLDTVLPIGCIIIIMFANMLRYPVVNGIIPIFLLGLVSYFFYYENNSKIPVRVLEMGVMLILTGGCDVLGGYFLGILLTIIRITPGSIEIRSGIERVFSKILLLFLYYVFVRRLWVKTTSRTRTQYILYCIMCGYSLVNVLAIALISNKEDPMVWLVLMGCISFSDLYLFYFIKLSDERNYYKLQVNRMEQKENLRSKNYEVQRENYEEALKILHDVEKHIKTMESLYQEGMKREALNYTRQIRELVPPRIPFQYSDNQVLNCLLSEKVKMAEKSGIRFEIKASTADINFMEPLDITTLFGNLLDNAITASGKCQANKYIGLFIQPYNEMVSIRVENSISEPVNISNGKIRRRQGGQKEIGLLNIQGCVNTYEGSLIYKCSNYILVCDIILNRTDV